MRETPQSTGKAVLEVWNARFNIALDQHRDLRTCVLIRNMNKRKFLLFEVPLEIFPVDEFEWSFNKNGNLIGVDKSSGAHRFTWQPHGSQFTVLRNVPGSAREFSIEREIPTVSSEHVLQSIGYQEDWITVD